MNIDPNSPAFPVVHAIVPRPGSYTTTPPAQPGLSIRAEIASRIMAGFAADPKTENIPLKTLTKNAVVWADALIEELNKP